jgi:hypothetical protein
MTTTNIIFRFAQRALWLYIVEAAVILGIVIAMGVHK